MKKRKKSANAGLTRREALRLGAAGAAIGIGSTVAASFAAPHIWAQSKPTVTGDFPALAWKAEFRTLAPNVMAYIQVDGPDNNNTGVSNAGCLVGPDFLMSIDALAAPIHAKTYIAAAKKATNKSFGRLLNTHHHGDHTDGNVLFLPAEIIAHDYCREVLLKSVGAARPSYWQKRDGWADGTEEWKVVPPVRTFNQDATFYLGGLEAHAIFVGPAHTWDDVIVHLPAQKIAFIGDVGFFRVVPTAFQGYVSSWIDACNVVLAMDADVLVPGHGPIGTKQQLQEMRDYFVILRDEAKKRHDAGMTPGHAAADINMGKFDQWPNPDRILANVLRLYAEFDGTISPATDGDASRKATDEYNKLKGKKGAAALHVLEMTLHDC